MKYELVKKDTIKYYKRILYRIRALRDFGFVKEGQLGGYIESEINLSHAGLCWVYKDAKVYGYAYIHGDARVCDEAQVYGNAIVCECAFVYGKASVCGCAWIGGNAHVCGYVHVHEKARVSGNVRVFENTIEGDDYVIGDDDVIYEI